MYERKRKRERWGERQRWLNRLTWWDGKNLDTRFKRIFSSCCSCHRQESDPTSITCETDQNLFWNVAAAAKSLQSYPTLCDPIDSGPPGSPVPGILQEEHWSGLPFSSPMHEREKWKSSRSVVSDSSWPHGLQPTRLLCPWDFPGKSTGVGYHCLLHFFFLEC